MDQTIDRPGRREQLFGRTSFPAGLQSKKSRPARRNARTGNRHVRLVGKSDRSFVKIWNTDGLLAITRWQVCRKYSDRAGHPRCARTRDHVRRPRSTDRSGGEGTDEEEIAQTRHCLATVKRGRKRFAFALFLSEASRL